MVNDNTAHLEVRHAVNNSVLTNVYNKLELYNTSMLNLNRVALVRRGGI